MCSHGTLVRVAPREGSRGTAADRAVRIVTAGIVAAALVLAGCPPRTAALPPGFPNLDSFAQVSVDSYITTGPKGLKCFVNFSTPHNIECIFTATTDPVPAGDSQGILAVAGQSHRGFSKGRTPRHMFRRQWRSGMARRAPQRAAPHRPDPAKRECRHPETWIRFECSRGETFWRGEVRRSGRCRA